MRSGEERGQFGTHKDKSKLASFLDASNIDDVGDPQEKLVLLVTELYMFSSQDSEVLKEEIWRDQGELQANCYSGQQHEPAGQQPQALVCGTNADPRSEHNGCFQILRFHL